MKFDTFGVASDYTEPQRKLDPVIYDLRKLRYERGLSQGALAKRMGYSAKSLKEAESGLSSPNFRFIRDWATALEATLEVKP